MAKVGEKAMSAKERSLDRSCAEFMQRICQKYDDVAEVDKLAAVSKKVDTVKIVMQENVDAALQNCVKLESIELAAGKTTMANGGFTALLLLPQSLTFVCLREPQRTCSSRPECSGRTPETSRARCGGRT